MSLHFCRPALKGFGHFSYLESIASEINSEHSPAEEGRWFGNLVVRPATSFEGPSGRLICQTGSLV